MTTLTIGDQVLFALAKAFYKTEVAHSSEMKESLRSPDQYHAHRMLQVQRVAAAAERYQIPIKGKSVVDFGCYDGALSAEYLKLGASKVVGVDIDENAILQARERHPDVTFLTSATDALPLADTCADTVISYDVFEHVSHPDVMLKEIHRVLRPGGKALIGTWGWYHPFAPHLWSVMPVPWAHVFFSEQSLLRVCEKVYCSSWYIPTMHDFDEHGKKIEGRFAIRSISTDYVNKLLIRDFEREFAKAGFTYQTHSIPFGSKYASWTRVFCRVPWVREFVTGYVWFELTRP